MAQPYRGRVFAEYPGVACSSAGLNADAENLLTAEQVENADLLFVMEPAHKTRLAARFKKNLRKPG